MKIGPRYKKARYLGAPVFRKTQTQKFALRAQGGKGKPGRRGGKSQYGSQMLEKQKARYSYGISNKQFTNYVNKALQTPGNNAKNLISLLESRLDNVILKSNLAPSRSAARQMVSHGHIVVNGTILTIPSYSVRVGDKITIREGSKGKGIFAKTDENLANLQVPAWMKIDTKKKEITIEDKPIAETDELLFDIRSVLEFYSR